MSADAATLRCPSCGAPAPAASTRCGYCRSRLATISCPRCFNLLFEGSRFCPHCGEAKARTVVPADTVSRCPGCRGQMRQAQVGAIVLFECGGCDGTWVDRRTFETLCTDRESQAKLLLPADADAEAAARARRPHQAITYRPCPVCRKLMNRVNFGKVSGTIMDVCKQHGVFLDRGELHDIVRFILDGGLDRMRESERVQLVEEQRRLRALERDHGRIHIEIEGGWSDHSITSLLSAIFER